MVRWPFKILFVLVWSLGKNSADKFRCDCYPLGTQQNIDQESFCNNETGECECHQNVVGLNCDRCKEGFYNILSGNDCSDCLCDPLGTIGKQCDAQTGQCKCKTGFIGSRCDRCESFKFKFEESCQDCNCNIYGAYDLQCNAKGECACFDNVIGKRCDACKENMHSLKEGCVPCPKCYNLVNEQAGNLTDHLKRVVKLIEKFDHQLPLHIQSYQDFLEELKLLHDKIDDLKLDYEAGNASTFSSEHLEELKEKIRDLHREVDGLLEKTNEEFGRFNITKILDDGTVSLDDAKNLVESCEMFLNKAKEILGNLANHSEEMRGLAQGALDAAGKIEKQAENFKMLTENISLACGQSCEHEKDLKGDQDRFQTDLEDLKKVIVTTKKGLKIKIKYFKGFHLATKSTKEKALDLQAEAEKLTIPHESVVKELDFETNENLLKKVNESKRALGKKEDSVRNLLEEAENNQKIVEDNLNMAKIYQNKADVIINDTEDLVNTALKLSLNLTEYEKIVQSVADTLKRIPKIREKIDAVTKYSDEIKNIFIDLTAIIQDLNKLKANVSQILKSDEGHRELKEEHWEMLENLEEQEKTIAEKLEQSHATLKDAKRNLKDLQGFQEKIEYEIRRINEYIVVFNLIPTSEEELNEVEWQITTMEEMIWTLENLVLQKRRLEMEIKNIKDIIESIPIDSTLCEAAKSEPKTTEK